jgi:hypothetical protein
MVAGFSVVEYSSKRFFKFFRELDNTRTRHSSSWQVYNVPLLQPNKAPSSAVGAVT